MTKIRRLVSVLLVLALCIVAFPAGQVSAGTYQDQTDLSNTYNNKIAPIANYNADQVSPYNLFFANRKESVEPGNGALTVTETDLVLSGRNGLDLTLQRVYQSQEANVYRMGTAVQSREVSYWVSGYWSTRQVWVPPVTTCTRTCTTPCWNECTNNCTTTCTQVQKQRWVEGHYEEDRWIDTGCMCWKSKQVWIPGYWETYYETVCTETCTTTCKTVCGPTTCTDNCTTKPGYWTTETYWVDGYWSSYTDYYVVNQRTTDTWVDQRNAIGVGWQWNLPGLEIRGSDITYHDGTASLLVDWNSPSHFKDYLTTDIYFDNDSGTFSNGQTTSRYKVTAKDKKVTYFGSDGRLLGIVDRYGNKLTYQHADRNGHPVISQITDTIGRTVTFTYSATQVTVTAPGGRVWKYNLTATEGGKVLLNSMQDPLGRNTSYTYSVDPATFSFLSRSSRDTTNYYANLKKVTLPTGGATNYAYSKTVDSLGDQGSREVYKVSTRSDTVNATEANRVTYTYSGEPGGYPNFTATTLPSAYIYSGTMAKADGTTSTVTYNNRHLAVKTETNGTGYRTVEEVTFDSNKLPAETKLTYYSQAGTSRTVTTARTYDSRRNVTRATDALGTVTDYTYDPAFSQLTSAKVVRSDGTVIQTLYTINAATGNLDSVKREIKEGTVDKSIWTYYTYDSFGNMTKSRLQMSDGTYRERTFEYEAVTLKSAYLTREAETYTAADGTAKTAASVYGYNVNTGLLTSYTDPLGFTTTVAYDALSRPVSLTYPPVESVTANKLFAYDDANAQSRVTDEAGRVTTYQYDQLGRLAETIRTLAGVAYTARTVTYDSVGRLSSEMDAKGNTTSYSYDGGGRVTKVTYADQTFTATSYDDAANATTVTDPNGNSVVTFYDVLGHTVQINTKPNKDGTRVYETKATYDNVGNLTSTQDARGNKTYSYYDALNRLTRQVDALGTETLVAYNNASERISETIGTGPSNRTTIYTYDPAGRLLTVTDPLGGVIRYTYDAKGRRLSQTDPRGNKTGYVYDARDRLTQQTDALNGVTTFSFDAVGNRTGTKDALMHTTAYAYDEWNRLTSVTNPLNATTRYTYDLNGNQTGVTDPLGNATTYEYDMRNRLVKETNALNVTVATHTYDGAGNRTSSKDARGGVTTYTYDGLNRLIKTLNPLGTVTMVEYDAAGNVIKSIDGLNRSTSFSYDALNRLIAVTDALNATWRYTLDAYGNVTRVTDPLNRVAREDTYDKLDRRVTTKDALGNLTTNSYDAVGNLVGVQTNGLLAYPDWTLSDDPNADGLATGWLTSHWTNGDDTASATWSIDDSAQKITIANHGAGANGTMQDYNAAVYRGADVRWPAASGDVFTLSLDYRQEGGSVTQFQLSYYDAAGTRLDLDYSPSYSPSSTWKQVSWTPKAAPANTVKAGVIVIFRTNATSPNGTAWYRQLQVEKGTRTLGPRSMSYDALNRLTRLAAAGGLSVDFTYDSVGNRTKMVDSTGTNSYAYDAARQLLTRTLPDAKAISYEYDLAGRLSKVIDYGGNPTTYTRDKVGRITGAQYFDGSAATFGYDIAGNRTSLTLPGGLSTSYTYDEGNRVTALTNRNGAGAVLGSYSYTYDAADNLVAKVDAKGQTAYAYDADDRLVTVTQPSGAATTYEYDVVGNRKTMTDLSGTTTYTYDAADQLTQETSPAGTRTYVWDKNGNQLSDGINQFEYDSMNRLTAVTVQGQRVTYTYDGDDAMVSRSAGGQTTRFYMDRDEVINEGDGSGAVTASMFQGGGLNLGRKVGTSSTAYYLYDAHGDVVGVADNTGVLMSAYEYDAFGVLTARTGTFDNPYLYAGEYYDYTTGQYYLRSRFYSPRLGRFLSRDTYRGEYKDPLSLHLYTYVKNNPLMYVDPSGHAGKILIENSQGGRNDQYLAEVLVGLEMLEISKVLSSGEMYIPTSAYDLASQMGIDHEIVDAVAGLMLGEEEAAFSKERYGQYIMQQELVRDTNGFYTPQGACMSFGCRWALTSGLGTMGDVAVIAAHASAMIEGASMAPSGLQKQFFRNSTLPKPSDFAAAPKAPSGSTTTVRSSKGAWAGDQPTGTAQKYGDMLKRSGDRVPIGRNDLSMKDLASLSSSQGVEFAIVKIGNQRYLVRGTPNTTTIPEGAKLIVHVHPGKGYWGLQPSPEDHGALKELGQSNSVLMNEDGAWRTFNSERPSKILHNLPKE